MVNRKLIMLCAMLVAGIAFARDSYEGAWAFAEDPDKPVLVITNETAWLLREGVWHPGKIGASFFRPVGEATERTMKIEEYKNEITLKDVESVGNRDCDRPSKKIVSTPMPRLSVDMKRYIGFWKPVKVFDCWGKEEVVEKKNEFMLKLREDGYMITYFPNKEPTLSMPEPFRVEHYLPVEAGLRVDYRKKEHSDSINCKYQALWIDPAGRLHMFDSHENAIFERTDATFDDPVDRRAKMVKEGTYHGAWGVNSEFNIAVLLFDRSGKGYFTVFMGLLPFKWKVREDGIIVCRPEEDVAIVNGFGGETFTCSYDSDKNTMTILTFPIRGETPKAGANLRKELPFMSAEVNVDEVYKGLEETRKNPQWRFNVQQAKERIKRRSK